MVTNAVLESYFKDFPDLVHVSVTGDGYHYHLTLVSDFFQSMKPIARQREVYKIINPLILSGTVHALTMDTWTKEEWEQHSG